MTTKSGLNNCLKQVYEYDVNTSRFFPRCYELGNDIECNEFIKSNFTFSW
jgi:hypothetical protein